MHVCYENYQVIRNGSSCTWLLYNLIKPTSIVNDIFTLWNKQVWLLPIFLFIIILSLPPPIRKKVTMNKYAFWYSTICKDGAIEEDVEHRIKAGWLKWRLASGVHCDRHIATRLNRKFYKTTIKPTMTYGAKCWPIKKQHMHKMSVVKMRMLRKTRKDRIINQRFREHLVVASIGDKIIETCLRWFRHI